MDASDKLKNEMEKQNENKKQRDNLADSYTGMSMLRYKLILERRELFMKLSCYTKG
jgi:hypothetical protein